MLVKRNGNGGWVIDIFLSSIDAHILAPIGTHGGLETRLSEAHDTAASTPT